MRCDQERESYIKRKQREEREAVEEQQRLAFREHELRRCYAAIAATPEGRTILGEYASDDLAAMATTEFKGNAQDSFRLGRAYQAQKTREILKAVLPREIYLEIIYPKEKENGSE